jgi:hypothetical protein
VLFPNPPVGLPGADAVDLRLRIAGSAEDTAVILSWENGEGGGGSHRIPVTADGDFHTYRLHLHKEPQWRPPLAQLRLKLETGRAGAHAEVEIDHLRLRDFPNPGGGNISSGLLAFDEEPADWDETARLLDRWRFVAGQSYKGNLARLWQSLGRPFRQNHLRWETDHPTWQWLVDKNHWPRHADGAPDLKAAARLGYEDLNAAATYLEKRGARLDAVHFDGLLKRLVMPWGHPHADPARSPDGGLFEHAGQDYAKAYRLAAETFCEFLVLCRNEPDSAMRQTRFYIQPNFHVWAWRDGALDYGRIFTNLPDPGNFREMMDALEAMDRKYLDRGAYEAPSPLAGYGADWVFMDRQPRRLTSFEWHATEVCGREFNVVNNGTLKGDSPAERAVESVEYLLQLRGEGGRPTSYTPYFWQTTWRHAEAYGEDGYAVLPEDEPHTVTWTLLECARKSLFMDGDALPRR